MPNAGEMCGGNVFHAGEKGQRVLLQILKRFQQILKIQKFTAKAAA
jgi:hypothetical protein